VRRISRRGKKKEKKKKNMSQRDLKDLKDVYETPRASVRGVFLCESVAVGVQSPVKRVTLEDWSDGATQSEADGDVALALW
jgi:hypothetical protein